MSSYLDIKSQINYLLCGKINSLLNLRLALFKSCENLNTLRIEILNQTDRNRIKKYRRNIREEENIIKCHINSIYVEYFSLAIQIQRLNKDKFVFQLYEYFYNIVSEIERDIENEIYEEKNPYDFISVVKHFVPLLI